VVSRRETAPAHIYRTRNELCVLMQLRTRTNGIRITRRQVLATGGTVFLTSIAGCSGVIDFTSEVALEEVNVFNMADQQINGSINVDDPAGDTALETTYDLEHEQDQNYSDVLGATGEYTVSVELTNTSVEGSSQSNKTVSINDADQERIGVVFNTNGEYDPIVIRVGTTPKDFLDVAN